MTANLHPVDPSQVKNILVVEDDKDLIEVLKVLMRDVFPEAKVQTANNIEEAMRLLNPGQFKPQVYLPYDLVFADIFLNGPGTGLDILRLCRTVYPGLHLLLSSAMPKSQLADLLKGEEVPHDYLEKPFSLEDCREKMRAAVYRN
jgi:CheY-like chemotaxis protein